MAKTGVPPVRPCGGGSPAGGNGALQASSAVGREAAHRPDVTPTTAVITCDSPRLLHRMEPLWLFLNGSILCIRHGKSTVR